MLDIQNFTELGLTGVTCKSLRLPESKFDVIFAWYGLPVKYCTNNKYIRSHLDALDEALRVLPIDSPKKVQEVHGALGDDVLERGHCGVFRDFKHYARSTGYPYTDPNDIVNDVNDWSQSKDEPFQRHIVYECIHPFSDGNGRSGRIIMASDLNFDFYKLNDLIGDNYINSIVEYQNSEE